MTPRPEDSPEARVAAAAAERGHDFSGPLKIGDDDLPAVRPASALLRAVPGPAGGRARSSVGVFRLPQDATVELHLVAAVRV